MIDNPSECDCENLRALIDSAPNGGLYSTVKALLAGLNSAGKMELLAGDCNISENLDPEQHTTVCHLLRCSNCHETYFIGVYCRGGPAYKYNAKIPDRESLERVYWGKLGSMFQSLSG